MSDSRSKNLTTDAAMQSRMQHSKTSDGRKLSSQEEKSDFTYNMTHKNRGDFIILVMKDFENPYRNRDGTDKEVEDLKVVAKNWGFKTTSILERWDLEDPLKEIEQWAARNHEDDDCVVIAILTHGSEDHLEIKYGRFLYVEIWDRIKGCNSMEGKPVIFIVQACRGNQKDESGKLRAERRLFDRRDAKGRKKYFYENLYPTEPDYIIIYATVKYFTARRQLFCEAMREVTSDANKSKLDLMSQMTAVARNLSLKNAQVDVPISYASVECINMALSPEIFSTLRGEVFLPSGNDLDFKK